MAERRSALLIVAALLGLLQPAFAGTNEFGRKFLEENKKREGVITLPSGLQYKVLRKGEGTDHPTEESMCEVHQEGRLAQNWPDGEFFESSVGRGIPKHIKIAHSSVLKAFREALKLMVEGDKWELYVPSELAYGDHGAEGFIGAGEVSVWNFELMIIHGEKKASSTCDVATQEGCTDQEKDYISKHKSKSKDELEAELQRLHGLHDPDYPEHKREWMHERMKLLRKLRDEL